MPNPFVPFGITVCGLDELEDLSGAGITHVLSILDPGMEEPAAFGSYGEHERLQLNFDDIIEDKPPMRPPQVEHVEALLAFGRDLLAEPAPGAHLLVHCHAGVSRSTASMTLLLAQARPDRPAGEALAEVVRIRPRAWPNLRILEIGDRLLGRDGTVIAAARRRYAAFAAEDPGFADFIRSHGRGRELDGLPA